MEKIKNFLTKLRTGFATLPNQTKKLLGLGLTLVLVVTLPLFVWGVVTQRFYFQKHAASGETPFLQILYPNGGEKLCLGKKVTIKWLSSHTFSSVDLLSVSKSGVSLLIAKNIPDTGSFEWQVNVKSPDSSDEREYKIYIYGYSDSYYTVSDQSDGFFSILSCVTPTPQPQPSLPPTPVPSGRPPSPTPIPSRRPSPTPAPSPITNAAPVIWTPALPEGVVGIAYSATVIGYDTDVNDTLSMNIHTLPPGLSFGPCASFIGPRGHRKYISCGITGIPTVPGQTKVTVILSDQKQQVTKLLNLVIVPMP